MILRLLALLSLTSSTMAQPEPDLLTWQELPPLPDAVGFAGSYAGVSQGALLVAGGANFPDKLPWEGGTKIWYDTVFVLENPAGAWKPAGRLPQPGGYGVALTVAEGILLIGGGDARENFRTVRLARWNGREIACTDLPALPLPLAMSAGAVAGRIVYVAGGLDRPDAATAQQRFLALDLDRLAAGWRELEPWPGPGLLLATAGVLGDSFYLFGGAALVPGPDGRPVRDWRREAWRYTPGLGWKRLADLPKPLVATPGPAPALVPGQLLLLGGDDGSLLARSPQDHPGFPRDLWAYDAGADAWARRGTLPFSLVTTTAVLWRDRIVVTGGEQRPGIRSTAVWSGGR